MEFALGALIFALGVLLGAAVVRPTPPKDPDAV